MKNFVLIALLSLLYPTLGYSDIIIRKATGEYIETHSAAQYLGKEVTVCGKVVEHKAFKKGAYLNFDRNFPQQTLTLVLWKEMIDSVESKLGRLSYLSGVELCAHGRIDEYQQRLQIQVADASDVELKSKYLDTVTRQNSTSDSNVERIEAYRAPFYVGKQIMACGVLAGTAKFNKGVYLNLDKKYPNQSLTLVVWNESIGSIEAKFGSLDSRVGQTFCALGTVEKYKNSLQVKIENPQFLRLMQ